MTLARPADTSEATNTVHDAVLSPGSPIFSRYAREMYVGHHAGLIPRPYFQLLNKSLEPGDEPRACNIQKL